VARRGVDGHGELVSDLAAAEQGGRSASTASFRSLNGAGISECTICGASESRCANCVPTPAGDEERRNSPVKPTASAKVERRRTNDADGLAKSERVGHRHPTRFRVVGLERGLGLDEVHLDLGVGISAATIGSAGVTRRRW